jgi:hypothetical protein
MGRPIKSISNSEGESELRCNFKGNNFTVLHHNVQSLWNKRMELAVLLNTTLNGIDALCFTEHWLDEDELALVEISKFKLVSKFCRKLSKSGGSCIFVNKELKTREVSFLNDLSSEKQFEISHSDVHIFLKKLELLIDRMHKKKNKKKNCGDWNVNLLQENEHVQTLKNILASCGLINKVTSPTRVTSSSESLLDVMVINRQFNKNYLEVVNMGYSDHLAQILWVSIEKSNKDGKKFYNVYQREC